MNQLGFPLLSIVLWLPTLGALALLFVPRAVKTEPFDSQTVRITGGIAVGVKIVVRNATLVSQVR